MTIQFLIFTVIIMTLVLVVVYMFKAQEAANDAEEQQEIVNKTIPIKNPYAKKRIQGATTTVHENPIFIPRYHPIATPTMQKREARRRKNKRK